MRIAILSDIHSNKHAFEEVLQNIELLSIDEIWCCGDFVGYNAFPNECVNLLRNYNVCSVLGNHDWATVTGNTSRFNPLGVEGINFSRQHLEKENQQLLGALPKTRRFERDGTMFFMAHGSPKNPVFEYVFPSTPTISLQSYASNANADVVLLGHTHIPMEASANHTLFLNPGSVGQPRDGNSDARFLVFDTRDNSYEWRRVAYNIDAAAQAIHKYGLPTMLAERLYRGR